MEILALKLRITDDSVNALLAEHLPKDVPVENLRARITPQGVRVSGEYPTVFLRVAFETLWVLNVVNCKIEIHLGEIKVSGFPASMFRGMVFTALRDAAAREPGLTVGDDVLVIDPVAAAAAHRVPVRINLQSILCSLGSLVVEAAQLA
jgi:hypothetical protein